MTHLNLFILKTLRSTLTKTLRLQNNGVFSTVLPIRNFSISLANLCSNVIAGRVPNLSRQFEIKDDSNNTKTVDNLFNTFERENNLSTFTKKDKSLINQCLTRKFRQNNKLFLVEGIELIDKAIKSNIQPTKLYYNDIKLFHKLNVDSPELIEQYDWCYVDTLKHNLISISPNTNFFGLFIQPDPIDRKCSDSSTQKLPVTVILDKMQNPLNLGSILRTLGSTSIEDIYLIKGCCDVWNPKTIRSSLGGCFHMNIIDKVNWRDITSYLTDAKNVFIADKDSERVDILELDFFSKENAAAILPVTPFYSVDFTKLNGKIVLIVGGENGLSNDAYEYALKHQGTKIYIPQIHDMNSLNAAVVTGVISYEIQRQFNTKLNRN